MIKIGIDVGSTTLKCVVLDDENNILYTSYKRHYSRVSKLTAETLTEISRSLPRICGGRAAVTVSGSAGMGMANDLSLNFIQEVYATRTAIKHFAPETDVAIELGGEDAKIIFLTDGMEARMNGTCAGGTGAFIDQMASLMGVDVGEMDILASRRENTYAIASRCGVFAKSDVQPLINQGARKEDIAASIFYAVVSQTIAGLAQGRDIAGNILYLGGPLTFLSELRKSFDRVLGVNGICPENSLYYVALGAAYAAADECDIGEVAEKIESYSASCGYGGCARLFSSKDGYKEFDKRHRRSSEGINELTSPAGDMFLGVDAGSTTVKAVLCDVAGNIFRPFYSVNSGNPVPLIKKYLGELYRDFPDIHIKSAAVTGYGEDIIKNAFHIDIGLVETVAHYTAAKHFKPDVDFILDIGGQDIKCFKIHNGAVDSIFLNEACSSGCGSFLQTFASAMGYKVEDFAVLGIFAEKPVDLGSRCTVFMNSSVKQAQKDGASVEDISAGLSISVVKNALYKVIRCANAEALGKNIVVQGGTFQNDAVLRAFEREIGHEVFRPKYSGVMGAYGAALYAKSHGFKNSTILTAEELKAFTHNVKAVSCGGCGNNCKLTVNTFGKKDVYIAGNRCEKPLNLPHSAEKYDLFAYKNQLLERYRKNERTSGKRTVGIPMGLNMYELLPFWVTLFQNMGFDTVVSPVSTRKLYLNGQHTIPSDTVCYPAKLMHGHIEALLALDEPPDAIFYPGMSYNIDEGLGGNHYNCPVVAYYPQVLKANIKALGNTKFICDFIGLHNRREFPRRIKDILEKYFGPIPLKAVKRAAKAAYDAYDAYMDEVRAKGEELLAVAAQKRLPVVVLAGRPYHIDPEIHHGIDDLICSLGAVVLTEDSVSHRVKKFPTAVLNQWTYHSRLYAAAKFVADCPEDMDINLVQLVSFGCGVDAITTDEVRSIIEKSGRIYTQIKIDEITNTGTVKIRLRSLFAAAADKNKTINS